MTPDRWSKVKEIFDAALSRAPSERTEFLADACGDDESLRRQVTSLLSSYEKDDSFIESPAFQANPNAFVKDQELAAGQAVGHYRIVSVLGKGGMGEVYLAEDTRLHRQVAIKVLSTTSTGNAEANQRLLREAQAAAKLDHPNICAVYEVAEEQGRAFIVMTYVEGETLDVRLKRKQLELSESLAIAAQIADAIGEAHAHGIVHRDIKPANVIITPREQAKVMDFGLAKLQPAIGTEGLNVAAEAPTAAFLTEPGTIIGTVPYMSPEQVHGQRLDARTDVFSFGVMFYEMLTGQKLFAAESPAGTISAILTKEPPPLTQYPEELQRVVRKCLEKDREGRYQTMGEVALELEDVRRNSVGPSGKVQSTIHEDVTSVTEAASPVNTTDEVIVHKRNWRPDAELALLLALLIGGGLVYQWLKGRSAPIGSIAVLPFKNETNNKDLEWLSDGMPDSLINSLSQIPHLSVKSRSSVFRYKDRAVDPEKIATELSVQAVLEGRIMQHGDELTISLSLVDGSGNQVWGQKYDRKISQLVTLQSEIARDVSEKLRVRLSSDQQQKLTKDYTTNPQAYELYMRGRVHVFKLVPDEVQQGINDFQRAIDLDPSFALAYVGLSEANRSLAIGSEFNPAEYLPKAKAAAAKALALDDSLSEAHTAWGATLFWADRNWSEAESHYQRALELNPKSVDAHLFYAHLLSNTERFEESLVEIKRARALDPANPFVSSLEGQFLIAAGRPDDALQTLKETSALAPGFWFPHIFAASAYIAKGMNSEAIAEAHRATELAPAQTLSLAYEGYILGRSGKSDEARAIIDKLLKLSQEPGRWVPPYHLATVYNGLGNTDETIVWLNKALAQHDPKLAFLKIDRTWNNLRNDSRFQEVVKRAGF